MHLALAGGTRRTVLHQAHLSPDSHIEFRARRVGASQISLSAIAPTRQESAVVTNRWVAALTTLRRDSTRRQLVAARREQRRKVTRQWTTLHRQLQTLDANLARLDPKVYGAVWKYDAPLGLRPTETFRQPNSPVPVPEHGTVHELNLAFERIQLVSALEKLPPLRADRFGALAPTPDTTTRQIGRTGPTRVDTTPSALGPAVALWLAGLAVIAAATFVFFRRRGRVSLGT